VAVPRKMTYLGHQSAKGRLTVDLQSDTLVDKDYLNGQAKSVFRVDHVVRNTLPERLSKERVFNKIYVKIIFKKVTFKFQQVVYR
jgi:hypothetical protein